MKIIVSFMCLIFFTFNAPVWSQDSNTENNEQDLAPEVKEKKYVTDKLRLSLYKKADSKAGTLKLLVSGDVLYVLEKSGPYSKVRTEQGVTGWVKNGFLVTIPTASFLLIEEQKKNAELSSQLDKYSNTQKIVADYENTIQKMNSDNESTQQELEKTKQELDQINETSKSLQEEIEKYSLDKNRVSKEDILNIILQYWYVVLISFFVIFLIGFLMGKEMVEARIRKRFQGVKVL